MRKQTISSSSESVSHLDEAWLDLERLAKVEVTSESAEHPIESALIPDPGLGWRAAQPGKQTIRLIFDHPLSLGRILLRFDEMERGRTQEFVLRWLPEGDQSPREIVRQQYTFSPPATRDCVVIPKIEGRWKIANMFTSISTMSSLNSPRSIFKLG